MTDIGADPTVVLVDDHELLVYSLSAALRESGIRCRGMPPGPPDALLAQLTALAPTLLLLDLDLGEFGDATPLIAPLTAAGIRVLVLTAQTDAIRLALALEQGAIGIQSKTTGFDELVHAVRLVAASTETALDARSVRLLEELAAHRAQLDAERRPFQRLTDRERQTLRELAEGRTVQQIASSWVVSQATVRTHVQAILTKLDTTSQLQAVVKAIRSGWIDPERDGEQADRAG